MAGIEIEKISDTEVLGRRFFAAAIEDVFDAHTKADLMRQWMLGPDGWVMTECISEARAGGRIAISWEREEGGSGFSLSGEYVEVEPPVRIVHIERMHLPETTPDTRIETRFEPDGSGTRLLLRMTFPTAEAMESYLSTGAIGGMEMSYKRLEGII